MLFSESTSFKILNPLFDLDFDDDSPLDEGLNSMIDNIFGMVGDKMKSHLFASVTNSLMQHKGNGADIKNFLSRPSTSVAWQLANIAGISIVGDQFSDEFYTEFKAANPTFELSDDVFSPPVTLRSKEKYKIIEEILSKPESAMTLAERELAETANDVGFRFRNAFDPETKTMYVVFPPLGSDSFEEIMSGDMGKNNLFRQANYTFRKNGGIVAEPLFDIYSAHRPIIQELLANSGATTVYFVGHSLGGGVAHLAANDELWDGLNVQTTTFGAPAVGDSDFVSNYSKNVDVNRIVHSSDGVATFGTLFHPTQKVWDIAKPGETMISRQLPLVGKKWHNLLLHLDKMLGLPIVERGAMDLDDVITETHRSIGLDDSMFDIVNGDVEFPDRVRGNMVSYPRARAFRDLLLTKSFNHIATSGIIIKSLIVHTNFAILSKIDSFKNAVLVDGLKISRTILEKAGVVLSPGSRVSFSANQFTNVFNFNTFFLKHVGGISKYYEDLSNMPEDIYKVDSMFDVDGKVIDGLVDPLVDFDAVLFNVVDESSTEQLNYRNVRRDLLAFGGDLARPPLLKNKKFIPIAVDVVNTLSNRIGDVMSSNFKRNVKVGVNIARDKLDDIFSTAHYTNIDVPGFTKSVNVLTDFKPTLLRGKLNTVGINMTSVMSKQTGKLFTAVGGSPGVAHIGKFSKTAGELSQGVILGGTAFLKSFFANTKKLGTKSSKFLTKLSKYVSKEIPIISGGLEIGFTAWEIEQDLDVIEDEKAHVVWNGEIVFKLYNPDEYKELVMMQYVHASQDFDVSFDDFVNTWYGRLSSDDSGVLTIDGVRTDNPDFDIEYQTGILDVRDRSKYHGESKTLSVLKNLGLGVFNLALDISTFVTPGVGMFGGVSIGVVDEMFTLQSVAEKENGFTRALKYKVMNDSFRDYADKVMLADGREKDKNVRISLVDMYSTSARFIIIEYFKYSFIRESNSLLNDTYDLDFIDSELERIKKRLIKNGFNPELFENGASHFKDVGELYDMEPNVFKELAQTVVGLPVMAGGIVGSLLGNSFGGVSSVVGSSVDTLSSTLNLLDLSTERVNIYFTLVNNYYNNRKTGINTYYDDVYMNKVRQIAAGSRDQIDASYKLYHDGDLTLDDLDFIQNQIHLNTIMDYKLLDVSVNRNSEYNDDPIIIDVLEKYRSNTLLESIAHNNTINETLTGLLVKHSGVGNTRDLRGEMNMDILRITVDYILSISGNSGNDVLKEWLMKKYTNDSGTRRGGDVTLSAGNRSWLKIFKINASDLDILNETTEDSVSLDVENSVREQYLLASKVIDVFYDGRSIYRTDPDVVSYYTENGININMSERIDDSISEHVESVKDQLGESYESSFKQLQDGLLKQMNERESAIISRYENTFEGLLNDIENVDSGDLSRMDTRDLNGIKTDFNLKVVNGKVKLQQPLPDETGNLSVVTTDVLSENNQHDMGFADAESDNPSTFSPTGRILPFTINSGVVTVLFEDGSEEQYNGVTNSLVGSINVGYWIGPVPRGEHAPINTIDNFYMAYHIENQKDPIIASLRFISRVTKSINEGIMSVSKDLVEYNIAIMTLNFLTTHKSIYGLDLDSTLLSDGLGAELNSQLHEDTTNIRKGVLPNDIDFSTLDIELEDDVSNPLKRAADIAVELGDSMMSNKFRKVSRERDDMERVAFEYLDNVRSNISGVKNINPLQRLILEELDARDSIKGEYSRILIGTLGKKLFEFL